MIKIVVPEREFYDEVKQEFINMKSREISLEHSLVSISKWESKFKRSFLNHGPATMDELREYIRYMTITQNVNPLVYQALSVENYKEIDQYIKDPMTATTFSQTSKAPASRDIITAELIYYWMFSYGIPKECEKWHLNRLLALINVFSIKDGPERKMSKSELAARNRAINNARRAKLKTKG